MKKLKIKAPKFKILILIVLLIIAFFLYLWVGFNLYFNGKIYPGVTISGIAMGGQNKTQAEKILIDQFQTRKSTPLVLSYQNQNFTIDLANSNPQLETGSTVSRAFSAGRGVNIFQNLASQVQILLFGLEITPPLTFQNGPKLISQISGINQAIKKDAVPAQIILDDPITIIPNTEGQELDSQKLNQEIKNYLALSGPKPGTLPVKKSTANFTTERAQYFRTLLQNIKDKTITIHYSLTPGSSETLVITQNILFTLLDTTGKNEPLGEQVIDQDKLTLFLQDIISAINQPVADAKFVFDAGSKRVKEFQAAADGREVDLPQTATLITQAIVGNGSKDIDLPVKVTKSKLATADTNSYGITGLLGEGFSNFAGSIENRIYNIGLAASRINGTLIPAGAFFSFNATVGDISGASGYKPAYVIKSGRTVLDDGGGVCQVSTTLFRAVLNSGLPVIKRVAHAYRVGYYEQGFPPGLDATVFAPSVDFQFKNDTTSYILIQAHPAGTTLTIDLYGSPDGRVATLTRPVVTDQTPPPTELRQDDPTLPRGEVKQVDWSAWGANVTFYRTVKRGNETLISEKWFSAYKPWQAIYLVGTK